MLSSVTSLIRWPTSALFAWGGCWLLFALLLRLGAPPWSAASVATLAGVFASVLAGTTWRRIAVVAGFPLSLLLSGAVALPAWAWLLPLLLVALVYPMSAWRDAPLFPTPAAALQSLARHAPLPDGACVLDAGCGLGHGLRALRGAYPQAQLAGIEWSWPLRAFAALACPWAQIRQGDMWQADWSGYDLVYLFQRPESMPRAIAKARAEMRPGAWLVSLEFAAQEWQAEARLEPIGGKPVWLYRAPFRPARGPRGDQTWPSSDLAIRCSRQHDHQT